MQDGENASGTAAEALIGRAGRVAGRLARAGWRATKALPGGELAERQLLKLETAVVDEVRRRLEPADTTPGFAWRLPGRLQHTEVGDHEVVTLIRPMNGHVEPLRAGMAELLNQSANADAPRAAEYLYSVILRQLVPDEARILAALADGDPRPSVDVVVRNALGGNQRALLRNLSSVGRAAGVSAPAYVPVYLTRLHRLGVLDIGDEDPTMAEQYDILLTDHLVREAEAKAKPGRRGGTRIVRRTVRISDLGLDFWAQADPTLGNPRRP